MLCRRTALKAKLLQGAIAAKYATPNFIGAGYAPVTTACAVHASAFEIAIVIANGGRFPWARVSVPLVSELWQGLPRK